MPVWHPPRCPAAPPGRPPYDVGLRLTNSLTRSKVPFLTADGSNRVRWYMCGPTVYDASHLGHARTYLGFDIIRRVLTDYFGYHVDLVMNITDVDDKIILRANERQVGFSELAGENEASFLDDMAALGVAPPDVMTRVSEYVPEIVTYIAEIIEKGFAYDSGGSVYFDVAAFDRDPRHTYCKLCPEAVGNAALLAEGEGQLAQEFASDKRSPSDFALWKKSKADEPHWPSPWGTGRPGWHIECSVMASHIFQRMGDPDGKMDVHSGGVDLKFPHHDNEMAQAEAHSGCAQWVDYFVHSGHLHIKERKMSKSLKNFITIRQALATNSARTIRLLFLLHKYNAPMDYSDDTVAGAAALEKQFANFFDNVHVALRSSTIRGPQKWGDREAALHHDLRLAQAAVRDALCDDFDTPQAMSALQDLVKAANVYLLASGVHAVGLVVRSVAAYVTELFKVFGLASAGPEIGFGGGGGGGAGADLAPLLDATAAFRSTARLAAKQGDCGAVLAACDAFRDDALPPLGIRLEDREGTSVWKLADPEELKREAEVAALEERRKKEKKQKAAAEQAAKDALNKVPPNEYMAALTLEDGKKKYGTFGEDGLPLTLGDGKELNKNQKKKASKEYQAQQKKYQKCQQAANK